MAGWDGSGGFDRVHNFSADASAGINIEAARFDAEFDGIATGLENCVTRDGQVAVSADIQMQGFRFTGVGAATSDLQFPRVDSLGSQQRMSIGILKGATVTTVSTSAINLWWQNIGGRVQLTIDNPDNAHWTTGIEASSTASAVAAFVISAIPSALRPPSGAPQLVPFTILNGTNASFNVPQTYRNGVLRIGSDIRIYVANGSAGYSVPSAGFPTPQTIVYALSAGSAQAAEF